MAASWDLSAKDPPHFEHQIVRTTKFICSSTASPSQAFFRTVRLEGHIPARLKIAGDNYYNYELAMAMPSQCVGAHCNMLRMNYHPSYLTKNGINVRMHA